MILEEGLQSRHSRPVTRQGRLLTALGFLFVLVFCSGALLFAYEIYETVREAVLALSRLIRLMAERPGQHVRLLELGCGEGQIIVGALAGLVGYGFIGFLDDYAKVMKRRNLGITGRQKMGLQVLLGGFDQLMRELALRFSPGVVKRTSHLRKKHPRGSRSSSVLFPSRTYSGSSNGMIRLPATSLSVWALM